MSTNLETPARDAAAAVLRFIARDDPSVRLASSEAISEVIQTVFREHVAECYELLELQAKTIEAVHLLSSPPGGGGEPLTPPALQALLGERLDAIRSLTGKVMTTAVTAGRDPHETQEGDGKRFQP